MDFISIEEFKKQPEKVQNSLKQWCENNLQECDWVYLDKEQIKLPIDSVMDTRKENIDVGRVFYIGKCLCWSSIYEPNIIPLLTEGQLRKFIIGKGYKYIGINNFLELENKETWNIKAFKSMMQFKPDLEFVGDTALECCWKVVCEIAESKEI